jgi:aspartyl-tRNA(Asn)/glutamyl-tRNA(Gln) amidotransferase subunit A
MAGVDDADATSASVPVPDYLTESEGSISGLRIGLPKQYFSEDLNPEVAAQIHSALAVLEKAGAILSPVDLPHTPLSIATYYVIAPAEASANLSRFDGVRYGHRAESAETLHDLYTRSRSEGFGEEVKRRILVGTYALSAGFYDAYYKKAQQVRRVISEEFQAALQKVDVIAGPAAPGVAFPFGAKNDDPLAMYMEDVYTLGVNLAGLPAMSLPAGFVGGLPVGLQLIGRAFDEATLLRAGRVLQSETDWHLQRPPVRELAQ